jgi:hypothetical protein
MECKGIVFGALDLVGVREVIWDGSGAESAEYTFFYEKGKGIISAVKKAKFVSDRMSYIILRHRRCMSLF